MTDMKLIAEAAFTFIYYTSFDEEVVAGIREELQVAKHVRGRHYSSETTQHFHLIYHKMLFNEPLTTCFSFVYYFKLKLELA